MGYIKHNAIVITTWDEAGLARIADFAKQIGLQVLGPSDLAINGYRSILVCPDGSKEGWEDSDAADQRRDSLIAHLRSQRHDDGSSNFEWFEAAFGSDDGCSHIVRDAWSAALAEQRTGGRE